MTAAAYGASVSGGRRDDGILICGAGAVGLSAALALAGRGHAVTVIGPPDPMRAGRTVALLEGSVRMLAALGVWRRVEAAAAPLRVMRILDDTGSLFAGPPVDFRAAELGLPAFGFNIDNADLGEGLEAAVRAHPAITRLDVPLARFAVEAAHVRAEAADGRSASGRLLLAADGAASPTRAQAGIGVRERRYPQVALTMLLAHEAPHGDASSEFHTRQGPFTLVPMVPAAGAPHRSSLVWVMRPAEAERRAGLPPAALAAEVERQSRRLLGRVRLEGAVGRFPLRRLVADRLAGERLALLGEAAHALPPIGAQGLNLSLRDVATLADHLGEAGRRGLDPGAPALLAAYARSRAGDIALRAGAVDALNRALLTTLPPVDLVRAAGLRLLAGLGGPRRALMRFGLMPSHDLPGLMRAGALDDPFAPR